MGISYGGLNLFSCRGTDTVHYLGSDVVDVLQLGKQLLSLGRATPEVAGSKQTELESVFTLGHGRKEERFKRDCVINEGILRQ